MRLFHGHEAYAPQKLKKTMPAQWSVVKRRSAQGVYNFEKCAQTGRAKLSAALGGPAMNSVGRIRRILERLFQRHRQTTECLCDPIRAHRQIRGSWLRRWVTVNRLEIGIDSSQRGSIDAKQFGLLLAE